MSELKAYGMDDPKVGDEYEMYKVSEVDAVLAEKDAKIRKLKRALYKACANWAKAMDFYEDNPNELWSKMKYKCRAKAEEYK